MSQKAPVTVIIPMLNTASTLSGALSSVLGQRPCPAEVICIDGGSTDPSIEIAKSFGVQVVQQVGSGLACARNQAIRKSREPWIAFCDADDRWAPDALATRMRIIEAKPETKIVLGHVVREKRFESEITPAQERLVGHPVPGFTPGAMVAHRRVFETVGPFDESLTIGADSDWFVRLHESDWIVLHLDDVVLFKGVRASSLSANVGLYRRELLTIARRFVEGRRGDQNS